MNPSIRTTYLATSRKGTIVASFDSLALLRAFIAKQQAKGVKLCAVEESTVRKPLVERRSIPTPLKLVEGKR